MRVPYFEPFIIDESKVSGVSDRGGKKFSPRKLNSLLLDVSRRKMRPSKDSMESYRKYIARCHVKALQEQLDVVHRVNIRGTRYMSGFNEKTNTGNFNYRREQKSHVGYASGSLYKSIKANVDLHYSAPDSKGFSRLLYESVPIYNEYGDYVSKGRKAGYIPIAAIVFWIRKKQALGSFKLMKGVVRTKSKGIVQRANVKVLSIAIAISKAAAQDYKPPVLKDWNNYQKNAKLKDSFNKVFYKNEYYYRNKINNSIIDKFNK